MRHSLIVLVAVAACGGGSAQRAETTTPAATTAAATAAPLTADAQVAQGQQLFGEHCAKCHGDSGQGGKKAPPLVGPGVLPLDPRPGQKRDVKFGTALDVFQWVRAHMPPEKDDRLADDQYLAILAFDLHANGKDLKGQPLDAGNAATIQLH